MLGGASMRRRSGSDIDIKPLAPTAASNGLVSALALPERVLEPSAGPLRIKSWIDNPAGPGSPGVSERTRVPGYGLMSMKLADEESP